MPPENLDCDKSEIVFNVRMVKRIQMKNKDMITDKYMILIN